MRRKTFALCAAILSFAGVLFAESGKTLVAYVGTGIKDPVIEIASQYEKKTGVKVELVFGNSGTLLGQLSLNPKGDILMPGSMAFVEKARAKGLVSLVSPAIAYHVPVIVTPKGNPAKILTIKDFARPGVKIVLPDKTATALGPLAFKMFAKLGIADDVEKNLLAYMETPQKVVAAMLLGQGDAGIIEASNGAKNADKLEIIKIDPTFNEVEILPCAVLSCTAQSDLARDFMDFAASEGPAAFRKYGFTTSL